MIRAGGRAIVRSTANAVAPVRPFGFAHHALTDAQTTLVRSAVRIRGANCFATPMGTLPFGSDGQNRCDTQLTSAAGPTTSRLGAKKETAPHMPIAPRRDPRTRPRAATKDPTSKLGAPCGTTSTEGRPYPIRRPCSSRRPSTHLNTRSTNP